MNSASATPNKLEAGIDFGYARCISRAVLGNINVPRRFIGCVLVMRRPHRDARLLRASLTERLVSGSEVRVLIRKHTCVYTSPDGWNRFLP